MDKKEKTQGTIARSGLVVSSMTLLSRIGGFVRDIFLAHLFGASQLADMFFVALRIPNFFRRMFAEGAFSQAFVPVMMRYKDQGLLELRDFLSSLSGIFLLGLLAFTFLGLSFPEAITALFAPGFLDKPSVFNETALLVRITFPYLALISMTAYSASLLNAHGRFAIPAITPIVLNICLIVAALLSTYLFLDYSSAFVLSCGVLVAGFLQLSLQLPLLIKLRLIPKPIFDTRHPGVRKVGTLLVPALFAASVNQINKCVSILKTKPKIKRTMWSRRAQEYDQKINSGKIYELAEVVKDLNKNTDILADQSYSERQLFEKAYDRLKSEFEAVLKTTPEEVQKKMDKALGRGKNLLEH